MFQQYVEPSRPADADSTVRIGGVEFVVGGWHAHEVERRDAIRTSGGDASIYKQLYAGRTFIHARDAVESIGAATWRRGAALAHSLRDLAEELRLFEETLLAALSAPSGLVAATVPPVCAAHLHEWADDERLGSDADALIDLGAVLQQLAAAFGIRRLPNKLQVPSIPHRQPVAISDSDAVADLERCIIPHLELLEKLQVELSKHAVVAKKGVRRVRDRVPKHPTGGVKYNK